MPVLRVPRTRIAGEDKALFRRKILSSFCHDMPRPVLDFDVARGDDPLGLFSFSMAEHLQAVTQDGHTAATYLHMFFENKYTCALVKGHALRSDV